MSVKELQKYTFKAKYANYLPEKKRRENWSESVGRSKKMMLDKYASKSSVHKYIEQAYAAVKREEVLGSQRALQFAGPAAFKHEARTYNCTASYIDRPEFFQQCMYLLLCGCGTGFSVQKHHVAKLPNLISKAPTHKKVYKIPDSIEGWSEAVGILINSYFQNGLYPEFEGKYVVFDDSEIRPAGASISNCSGKAPGPEPLMNGLEKIRKILNDAVQAGQIKLRPIQCYDIVMHSSDAVLAGGVRRSATICIFSFDDEEMIAAKTGNWFYENPQRGRSNNSALLLKNEITYSQFEKLIKAVRQFGEPGFIWADSPELLLNPCCEVSFWCYHIFDRDKYDKYVSEYGHHGFITQKPEDIGLRSGWQMCNLSTQNGAKIKTIKDFFRASKNAAIIGTLQAGFNNFPYLGETSNKIVQREALLGVSMTGIMESPDICLNPIIQQRAAKIVLKTNEKVAKLIGINPAARATVVKPEGTASCVLGTSSGIHPHHSKRYVRRVQANKMEPIYQFFKETNPLACEESVWSENKSDDVISFCIEIPKGAKTKYDVSAIDLLKAVKTTQENWITYGRNLDRCTQPWLNHNVSNTIHIKDNEWDEVTNFIYENRNNFCGISLLPMSGDKDYKQAPFSSVHLPSELIQMYGEASVFAGGLIEQAKVLFDDDLWLACDTALGIVPVKGKAKEAWVNRFKKYANNYVEGNLKKLVYCLKDVDTYKLFTDLKREYKPVDFDECIEEENNVKPTQELACSGGVCELK